MNPPRNLVLRPSGRSVLFGLIGLVAAVLATTLVASVLSTAWSPVPRAGPGESVDAAGLRFTVEELSRSTGLPDADGVPVPVPDGAEVVVLRYRVEVIDPGADTTIHCRVDLSDGRRTWPTDLRWLGRVEPLGAPSCAGTGDEPLAPDRPVHTAALFVLPAGAEPLTAEVTFGEHTVRFVE